MLARFLWSRYAGVELRPCCRDVPLWRRTPSTPGHRRPEYRKKLVDGQTTPAPRRRGHETRRAERSVRHASRIWAGTAAVRSLDREARPLPRADQGAGAAGAALPTDPARDPGARVYRRPDDPQSLPAQPGPAPAAAAPRLSPLRDPARGGSPVGLEPLSRADRLSRDDRARLQPDPVLLPPAVRGLLPRRAPAHPPLGSPGGLPLSPGPLPPHRL